MGKVSRTGEGKGFWGGGVQGVERRIILRWMLKDLLGERGVVARFCEHVNELSVSLKHGVFLE
jgi:hypothetical protein